MGAFYHLRKSARARQKNRRPKWPAEAPRLALLGRDADEVVDGAIVPRPHTCGTEDHPLPAAREPVVGSCEEGVRPILPEMVPVCDTTVPLVPIIVPGEDHPVPPLDDKVALLGDNDGALREDPRRRRPNEVERVLFHRNDIHPRAPLREEHAREEHAREPKSNLCVHHTPPKAKGQICFIL